MRTDLKPLEALQKLVDGLPEADSTRFSEALNELRAGLKAAEAETRELARAQANAVVHSGIIMAELQRARGETDKAREVAERASLAKSEFLASMSHDIRTPMNAVVGLTALALETELTPEQREYLNTVQNAATDLLWLINQILDLSKIEAGKLVLDKIGFDLRETLEEIAGLFAVQAEERGVDLVLSIAPGTPRRLVGDAGRLRQIISNLVGNATKFTHEGRIVIEATSECRSSGTAMIKIRIKDSAIGIATQRLPSLFDKYMQAESSTNRKYGGSGLGLSICRELAELMGGSVKATSEVGQGSEFWVRLEFPIDRRMPVASLADKLPRGLRVLVVEHDPIREDVLLEMLKGIGASVAPIQTMEELTSVLREAVRAGQPYDHVFIHQELAGSPADGPLRHIRKDPEFASTNIVLMGGMTQRPEALEFEEAGIASYLVLPIRETDLIRVLCREPATIGMTPSGGVGAGYVTTAWSTATSECRFSGLRVLVAEDNLVNQMVARRMLEKLGFEIEIACDGREAVDKATVRHYNLILMDCEMPEVDGYQATAEIRLGGGLSSESPIVALTAHAMTGVRERCLEAGMNDYISKPFKLETLLRVVSHWTEEAHEIDLERDKRAAA
jgi:signal transduction histidine kinase/CheY-like chemotaxis protein